jgi:hypothetical protein
VLLAEEEEEEEEEVDDDDVLRVISIDLISTCRYRD